MANMENDNVLKQALGGQDVHITLSGFMPDEKDINDVAVEGDVLLWIEERTVSRKSRNATNPTYLDIIKFANDAVGETLAKADKLNKEEKTDVYGVDHRFLENFFVEGDGDRVRVSMGS